MDVKSFITLSPDAETRPQRLSVRPLHPLRVRRRQGGRQVQVRRRQEESGRVPRPRNEEIGDR